MVHAVSPWPRGTAHKGAPVVDGLVCLATQHTGDTGAFLSFLTTARRLLCCLGQDLDTFLEAFPLVLGDDPAAYTLDLLAMSGEDEHDGSYFTGGSTVATSTHGSAATTLAAAAVDPVSARGVATQSSRMH